MLLTLKVLNILSKRNVDRTWHWLELSFCLYNIKTTVKRFKSLFLGGEEKIPMLKKTSSISNLPFHLT